MNLTNRLMTVAATVTLLIAAPAVTKTAPAHAEGCTLGFICGRLFNQSDMSIKVRGEENDPSTERWVKPDQWSPFKDTDQFYVPPGHDAVMFAGGMWPITVTRTGWKSIFDRPSEWNIRVYRQS